MSRFLCMLSIVLFMFSHSVSFAQSGTGDMKIYNGKYCQIEYPRLWIVNETPRTLTADVFIGLTNSAFGVWIFRFEKGRISSFKKAMEEVATRWRQFASVEISYVRINGVDWCKQDIQMDMIGEKCRQISYYTQSGGYIYNVKFGNSKFFVDMAISTINEMMNSFIIK